MCGNKNQTHVILAHNASYHELEPPMPCATDQAAHVYTLHIDSESGTYAVHIDDDRKRSGALRDDWKILPPRVVPDERYEKPSDWVDERLVDDPEDVKPIGWDDEAQIVDPAAEKPHDWNDDDDGEWEAPLIDNPGFNGTWRPRRVVNPAFVGEWSPPMLSNPDYFDDPSIGDMRGVDTLAMEIWQVRAGSLFDHFLITDDVELARARPRVGQDERTRQGRVWRRVLSNSPRVFLRVRGFRQLVKGPSIAPPLHQSRSQAQTSVRASSTTRPSPSAARTKGCPETESPANA